MHSMNTTKTVTLHCQAGDHTWERPSQRGRKPFSCPEHTVTIAKAPASKPEAPKPVVENTMTVAQMREMLDASVAEWDAAFAAASQLPDDVPADEFSKAHRKVESHQNTVLNISTRLRQMTAA